MNLSKMTQFRSLQTNRSLNLILLIIYLRIRTQLTVLTLEVLDMLD